MTMERNNKLIFCDVDGTLVDDFDDINFMNLEYIKSSSEGFVIVTGRTQPQIVRFMSENELNVDIIGGNGAFINYRNGIVELRGEIESDIVTTICKLLEQEDVIYLLHTVQGNFVPTGMDCKLWAERLAQFHVDSSADGYHKWVSVYSNTFLRDSIGLFNSHEEIKTTSQIIKIEVFSDKQVVLEKVVGILWNMGGIRTEKSYLTSVEIVKAGVSKGAAVKEYMDMHFYNENISSIAIGDNINDISMFEVVDYPFAVRNCCPGLEKYAKILKSSNKEPFLLEIDDYMEEI